jgi:Tfp pilus assembly protein PilW
MIIKNEKGQSLFELVVAIAISALVIVAIVSLTVNSIQNSNFSKNKARAATYAQQATEWLRGQRDNYIDTFLANVVKPYCMPDLSWNHFQAIPSTQNCSAISSTPFKRWVTFSTTKPSGKTLVEADVVVTWSDSQGLHQVTNATSFSDWRQR